MEEDRKEHCFSCHRNTGFEEEAELPLQLIKILAKAVFTAVHYPIFILSLIDFNSLEANISLSVAVLPG